MFKPKTKSVFVILNGVREVKNPVMPFVPSDLKGMLRRAQNDAVQCQPGACK